MWEASSTGLLRAFTRGHERPAFAAGDVARRDAPTCRLHEPIGEVRERVRAAGWDACVVVNDELIVMGMLREEELEKGRDEPIEHVMRLGPTTFRPHVPIEEMAHVISDHDLATSPANSSDGRLIGVLRGNDAVAAARTPLGGDRGGGVMPTEQRGVALACGASCRGRGSRCETSRISGSTTRSRSAGGSRTSRRTVTGPSPSSGRGATAVAPLHGWVGAELREGPDPGPPGPGRPQGRRRLGPASPPGRRIPSGGGLKLRLIRRQRRGSTWKKLDLPPGTGLSWNANGACVKGSKTHELRSLWAI